MLFFRIILAFYLISYCTELKAANIYYEDNANSSGGIVFISGDIRSGDDQKFRALSLQNSIALVVLNSNGGSLIPALEIGKIIRVAGYDTAVIKQGVCASSCALIWLAGSTRRIVDDGKVGFHAAYRETAGKPVEVGAANALIGGYLASLGLSTRAILFATSAPPDRILWINDVDTSTSGIEYRKVVSNAVYKSDESGNKPQQNRVETSVPSVGYESTSTKELIYSLSRSGEKWIKLSGFSNAYYDKSTFQTKAGTILSWILYDYTDQVGLNSKYEIHFTEFECRKERFRVRRIVTKDRDRDYGKDKKFTVPSPGSTERALLMGLCAQR